MLPDHYDLRTDSEVAAVYRTSAIDYAVRSIPYRTPSTCHALRPEQRGGPVKKKSDAAVVAEKNPEIM